MKIVFATGNKGKLREAAEILGDRFTLLSPAQVGITDEAEETGDTLKENSIIKAEYIYSRLGGAQSAGQGFLCGEAVEGKKAEEDFGGAGEAVESLAVGDRSDAKADRLVGNGESAGVADCFAGDGESAGVADCFAGDGEGEGVADCFAGDGESAGVVDCFADDGEGEGVADCFADDTGLEVDALGGAPGVHSARYATEGHDFEANIDKLLAELGKHPGEPRTARFRSVVTLIYKGERHFFEGTLEGCIAPARRGGNGFGYDPVFIPDCYPDRTVAELDDETKNAISHRGKALRAMAEWLRNHAAPAGEAGPGERQDGKGTR